MRVLACLAAGTLPRDVHAKLGITKNTVYSHISAIEKRLGMNWLQAVILYRPLMPAMKLTPAEVLAQQKIAESIDSLSRARQILRAP